APCPSPPDPPWWRRRGTSPRRSSTFGGRCHRAIFQTIRRARTGPPWPTTSSSATAARGGAPNEFRADVRRRAGREPRRCPRRRRACRRRDRRARPLHGRALGWLHARASYKLLAGAPARPRGAWERIEFFWGDERPVPPDPPESKYAWRPPTLRLRLSHR